ncbi:MAG: peptidylprolyl isomerase, partial [Bacteroidales bacterium]
MALKEGQISQIVETPDGFHLIQMVEKDGNMFNARHILLKPKYTSLDRDKAFKTLDSIKHKISVDSITFEMA